MAIRRRTRIKELERIDVELAALRDQRARIDARIASLEARRKAGLLEVVNEIVSGLDLSQVPVTRVLARLTTLDKVQRDGDDNAATEEDVDRRQRGEENIKTLVKLSRNTATAKRAILEGSGLRWNGRAAGWSGTVGSAELARLRLVFKERVTMPPTIDPGETPLLPQESDADALCVDEVPIATQSEPDAQEARIDEGGPAEQAVTAPVVTTFFRGLPVRRPLPSLKEPESPA